MKAPSLAAPPPAPCPQRHQPTPAATAAAFPDAVQTLCRRHHDDTSPATHRVFAPPIRTAAVPGEARQARRAGRQLSPCARAHGRHTRSTMCWVPASPCKNRGTTCLSAGSRVPHCEARGARRFPPPPPCVSVPRCCAPAGHTARRTGRRLYSAMLLAMSAFLSPGQPLVTQKWGNPFSTTSTTAHG